MKAFFIQISFLFGAAVFLRGEAADEVAQRYKEAFALVESLPEDLADALGHATSEELEKLERAFELVRENVGAESVDWGVDWETGARSQIPFNDYTSIRKLTHLAVAYHEDKLSRGETSRFVEDMEAFLRAGRNFAEGQGLGHYLSAEAAEGIVRTAIAKNAARLPPAVRDHMLRVWQATPPGPALEEVLEVERLFLRGGYWSAFAGTIDAGDGAPADQFAATSRLAEELRIASFVSIGGDVWIGFEEAETGVSFNLQPGQTRHGLELVWVDPEPVRALVRRGDESAIIELAGRSLVPIDLEAAWERVTDWVGQVARTPEQEQTGRRLLADLLEDSGGDKLAAFEAFLTTFDARAEEIVPVLESAYAELPDPAKVAAEAPGLFGELVAPFLVRAELRRAAADELLLTGLNHLRDPMTPLPRSAVTGDRLRVQETDEGLILESTFLHRDRPLTLVFPTGERN